MYLTRLELIRIRVHDESKFIASLMEPERMGCPCNETLEDIVIYELFEIGHHALNLQHLMSLKRLKRLCVGPTAYVSAVEPSTYLPTSIEQLTILEPDPAEFVIWPQEYLENGRGLVQFLEKGQYKAFGKLRTVRVKGLKERWENMHGLRSEEEQEKVEGLERMFESVGITYELKTLGDASE